MSICLSNNIIIMSIIQNLIQLNHFEMNEWALFNQTINDFSFSLTKIAKNIQFGRKMNGTKSYKIDSSKLKLTGKLINGQPDGPCTIQDYHTSNWKIRTKIQSGCFHDNEFEYECKKYLVKGVVQFGVPEGLWSFAHKVLAPFKYEGSFQNGKMVGVWKVYLMNGQVVEAKTLNLTSDPFLLSTRGSIMRHDFPVSVQLNISEEQLQQFKMNYMFNGDFVDGLADGENIIKQSYDRKKLVQVEHFCKGWYHGPFFFHLQEFDSNKVKCLDQSEQGEYCFGNKIGLWKNKYVTESVVSVLNKFYVHNSYFSVYIEDGITFQQCKNVQYEYMQSNWTHCKDKEELKILIKLLKSFQFDVQFRKTKELQKLLKQRMLLLK
uniref:Uncharacterized protein n=1 Tax=Trepomonas sp. PC1 TaxID=1076344 RepID=A0A146K4M9_9EUKA|eukprot:JAP90449.1 Hypothetical protein TPC1_30056 [Trepomonas sp. PC1]